MKKEKSRGVHKCKKVPVIVSYRPKTSQMVAFSDKLSPGNQGNYEEKYSIKL